MPKSLKLFFWIIHVTIVFSYPELAQVVPFHRTCFEFSKNRYSCCLQGNVQLQNNSPHPCLSICAEGSSHFDSASSSGAELHLHPSNTALSQDPPSLSILPNRPIAIVFSQWFWKFLAKVSKVPGIFLASHVTFGVKFTLPKISLLSLYLWFSQPLVTSELLTQPLHN